MNFKQKDAKAAKTQTGIFNHSYKRQVFPKFSSMLNRCPQLFMSRAKLADRCEPNDCWEGSWGIALCPAISLES